MKRVALAAIATVCFAGLFAWNRPVLSGQEAATGKLVLFADMALFAGMGQPRNCTLMNRFKPGEPVGFRVSVIDGATGDPAADAAVVIHLTFGAGLLTCRRATAALAAAAPSCTEYVDGQMECARGRAHRCGAGARDGEGQARAHRGMETLPRSAGTSDDREGIRAP